MEIRGITFLFSKNKAKQLHQKESDIQNRLQVLDRVISNSPNTDRINPFAPEPPVTARADPGPFYPL